MTWRVQFDHGTAFVQGPKTEARRRLAVCGDAAPIWVNRREAWATSTTAANRLLDQLEGRGISSLVEDRAQGALGVDQLEVEPSRLPVTKPVVTEPQVAQGALW